MSAVVNKSAPTFGGAIGYFAVVVWAIPEGYIDPKHVAEAVVFAGILATNLIMELKVLFVWIGSLFKKDDE